MILGGISERGVLIGGWATYIWATYIRTRVAKSYDIDTIVDHATLAKLGAKFQLSPSDRISGRKFELKVEGVGVDAYPVYQSKPVNGCRFRSKS